MPTDPKALRIGSVTKSNFDNKILIDLFTDTWFDNTFSPKSKILLLPIALNGHQIY